MRFLLLVWMLVVSLSVDSQVLKKKNLGVYQGEIPSYALELGEEVLQVRQAHVSVEFKTDGTLTEKIDSKETKGIYLILSEDKYAVYLEVKLDGQYIPENYVLYKKDRRLERKGIYPQPDAFLKKQ
ncbi:hypothetical protein [Fluviicola sp.]|uniref:hypothetical protein n=1 Tax=Fluviicola sp. TaxID=1917219 RepID=UPI00262ECE4A|nr:hypothetical protein [Fluviicola sp.]